MANPEVSVIIPTFNTEEKILKKCIESVLGQTVKNIEVIVVDDGSDVPFSGLNQVIQDPRIRWIENGSNKGVSYSRNIGMDVAKGDWIAFLDSDDYWAPNKLVAQLRRARKTGRVWLYTSAAIVDLSGKILSIISARHRGYILKDLLKEQVIVGSASSVMVKRNVAIDTGGFDSYVVEDWDYWIRLAKSYEVDFVDMPLVFLVNRGKGGRSSQLQERIDRVSDLFEKHQDEYERFSLVRYAKAHLGYVSARQHFIAGHYLTSAWELMKAVFRYPPYFTPSRIYRCTYFGARILKSRLG